MNVVWWSCSFVWPSLTHSTIPLFSFVHTLLPPSSSTHPLNNPPFLVHPPSALLLSAGEVAGQWFYAMAAACVFGLLLLHLLTPLDFNALLQTRLTRT